MNKPRNYFPLKTGHIPSDIYFKHQALYCDSELFKGVVLAFIFELNIDILAIYLPAKYDIIIHPVAISVCVYTSISNLFFIYLISIH